MGRPADGSPLVSSPRLGLVAWADASVPGVTRMVVWDVETKPARWRPSSTGPRVRPITFDGGWLRFGQGLRDWAWDPSGGPAQLDRRRLLPSDPNERTALVDAVAGTRLEQWGTFLRVVRAGARGEELFPGFGGSLSADGRLVLTRSGPGSRAAACSTPGPASGSTRGRPDWLVAGSRRSRRPTGSPGSSSG